jgi:hypothetical protein
VIATHHNDLINLLLKVVNGNSSQIETDLLVLVVYCVSVSSREAQIDAFKETSR